MNIKNINKLMVLNMGLAGIVLSMFSCNIEPDDSDLYTATGETAFQFVENDSTLSSFRKMLSRTHLDKRLSTWGEYTCFAPTNEAVAQYIDSLYNDQEAASQGNPHNGLTANSLDALLDSTNYKADSLCNEIVKYHLTDGEKTIISMGGGSTITTMLGRTISTRTNDAGQTVINDVSVITSADNTVTNGVVHVINKVIPRSTKSLAKTLQFAEGFSIFSEAFNLTGLGDSLLASKKNKTYTITDLLDTNGDKLYWPTECKLGFTIFAESDEVLASKGIHNVNDLIQYANEQYKDAAGWYDYLNETGKKVSTGNDYTNRFNALNMFIAYHILNVSMAQDQLVFENKTGVSPAESKWNYVNNGEPYDYYATLLPNTLIKIWQPNTTTKTLYINRYETFNTLTDELGTMGSDAMHQQNGWFKGVEIERRDIMAYNGYIHPIKDMLVYNKRVPTGVLKERMRFDATEILPEFINNGFRYMSQSEVSGLNGGGSGARIAFPLDYFDNVKCYTSQTTLRYNVKGDFRSYQADAFQGWGLYDLAVKLPHVPSGTYELRIFYSPMDHGGMMQFYIGNSTNVQEMTALDIPLDVRIPAKDARIGWTPFYEEDDKGVATDEAMRNRGYMRAPCSFRGHPDGTGDMEANNCRGDGVVTLRRILGKIDMKQSKDYWFRIKNVISDETDLKWQIDFIELVPLDVINNDRYSEDWY